jgi:hypothetical protein
MTTTRPSPTDIIDRSHHGRAPVVGSVICELGDDGRITRMTRDD